MTRFLSTGFYLWQSAQIGLGEQVGRYGNAIDHSEAVRSVHCLFVGEVYSRLCCPCTELQTSLCARLPGSTCRETNLVAEDQDAGLSLAYTELLLSTGLQLLVWELNLTVSFTLSPVPSCLYPCLLSELQAESTNIPHKQTHKLFKSSVVSEELPKFGVRELWPC